MKELRSASQILFGFLPEQTVDLRGRVWKVDEWQQPTIEGIDPASLRRELIRVVSPWANQKRDGGYVDDLHSGKRVVVLGLNSDNGVRVSPFPNVWMCKRCKRVARKETVTCKCGSQSFGQLPFVGYHDECGAIREPWVPRCKEHDDVKVVLPGTASAAEIQFICPECNSLLRKGLGFSRCSCGRGMLTFNVHRAASVYTPHTVVVVNPPSRQKIRGLSEAGGPARALAWVVGGMAAPSYEQEGITADSLLQQLIASGIDESVARAMVAQAAGAGQLGRSDRTLDVPADQLEEAESEAVTIAMAVSESRRTLRDLASNASDQPQLKDLYENAYPTTMARAGLETVELIEKFPVLTACFGYTRGKSAPGASRLVPFRDRRGDLACYGDMSATEALFVRLRASRVATWLERNGFSIGPWSDEQSARAAILRTAVIPKPGDEPTSSSAGSSVLTLVHSFAHRFTRRIAVFAGVDRNALSELIVPAHLGFLVYAAGRGDFVLGGLQAVFETELDVFLEDLIVGDRRCPLDPGCQRSGGACMACIHLGEPSCRYYNRFLDRTQLFGTLGYLR